MKLLIETAIIFFGTLLAAGLLALGDPGTVAPTFRQRESAQAPAVSVAATGDSQRNAPAQPAR